jgi:hypothetical protein
MFSCSPPLSVFDRCCLGLFDSGESGTVRSVGHFFFEHSFHNPPSVEDSEMSGLSLLGRVEPIRQLGFSLLSSVGLCRSAESIGSYCRSPQSSFMNLKILALCDSLHRGTHLENNHREFVAIFGA